MFLSARINKNLKNILLFIFFSSCVLNVLANDYDSIEREIVSLYEKNEEIIYKFQDNKRSIQNYDSQDYENYFQYYIKILNPTRANGSGTKSNSSDEGSTIDDDQKENSFASPLRRNQAAKDNNLITQSIIFTEITYFLNINNKTEEMSDFINAVNSCFYDYKTIKYLFQRYKGHLIDSVFEDYRPKYNLTNSLQIEKPEINYGMIERRIEYLNNTCFAPFVECLVQLKELVTKYMEVPEESCGKKDGCTDIRCFIAYTCEEHEKEHLQMLSNMMFYHLEQSGITPIQDKHNLHKGQLFNQFRHHIKENKAESETDQADFVILIATENCSKRCKNHYNVNQTHIAQEYQLILKRGKEDPLENPHQGPSKSECFFCPFVFEDWTHDNARHGFNPNEDWYFYEAYTLKNYCLNFIELFRKFIPELDLKVILNDSLELSKNFENIKASFVAKVESDIHFSKALSWKDFYHEYMSPDIYIKC